MRAVFPKAWKLKRLRTAKVTFRSFKVIEIGRESFVLWQSCDTLCTSGFMDASMGRKVKVTHQSVSVCLSVR